jgi:hypothetical protein
MPPTLNSRPSPDSVPQRNSFFTRTFSGPLAHITFSLFVLVLLFQSILRVHILPQADDAIMVAHSLFGTNPFYQLFRPVGLPYDWRMCNMAMFPAQQALFRIGVHAWGIHAFVATFPSLLGACSGLLLFGVILHRMGYGWKGLCVWSVLAAGFVFFRACQSGRSEGILFFIACLNVVWFLSQKKTFYLALFSGLAAGSGLLFHPSAAIFLMSFTLACLAALDFHQPLRRYGWWILGAALSVQIWIRTLDIEPLAECLCMHPFVYGNSANQPPALFGLGGNP